MPKIKTPENTKELPQAIVAQMLSLATSSFGLVAALAWNEFIKELVDSYIKPYLPKSSGIISLAIYSILVTILAIVVTLQLTKLQNRLEKKPK